MFSTFDSFCLIASQLSLMYNIAMRPRLGSHELCHPNYCCIARKCMLSSGTDAGLGITWSRVCILLPPTCLCPWARYLVSIVSIASSTWAILCSYRNIVHWAPAKAVRCGSQIWLQLFATGPTNRPQPKVIKQ